MSEDGLNGLSHVEDVDDSVVLKKSIDSSISRDLSNLSIVNHNGTTTTTVDDHGKSVDSGLKENGSSPAPSNSPVKESPTEETESKEVTESKSEESTAKPETSTRSNQGGTQQRQQKSSRSKGGRMTSAKKSGPRDTRGVQSHHQPRSQHGSVGGAVGGVVAPQPPDFPLRIVVQSDMVGAIIGKSGGTIKEITQQSKARVDVLRKDASGTADKIIAIFGPQENCSKACLKIMQVVHEEARNLNKPIEEFPLRILAHNSLIGRIIGKSGGTIKRIMEETNTKISIQQGTFDPFNYTFPERVIVIKGSLEDASKAESEISKKLRTCYAESEFYAPQPPFVMSAPPSMMPPLPPGPPGAAGYPPSGPFVFPPPPPVFSLPPAGVPYPPYPYPPPPQASGHRGSSGHFMPPEGLKYTATVIVPAHTVGAIIGSHGTTIREMIQSSGAQIKVAQGPSKEREDRSSERRVTVVGTPDAQWKAQVQIFKKVMVDTSSPSGGEVNQLKVEIYVPSSQVGRIIGKGGSTVRELQKMRKVQIKLPEPGSAESSSESSGETPVTITGDFYGCWFTQSDIRFLVFKSASGSPYDDPLPSLSVPSSRSKNTSSRSRGQHKQQPPFRTPDAGEVTSQTQQEQQRPSESESESESKETEEVTEEDVATPT